ncbi:hypothetical protein BKA80DRAFT_322776 [Phyllosticta citrichinensis]
MTSFPIPKCCASGGVPQSNICIPLDLRAFSVVIPAPPPRSPLLSSSALNDSVNFDEWVDMQGLVEEEEEEEEDGDSDVDMDIATPSTADEENNAGSGHRDNGEAGGASSTPPDTTTAAVTNDKATPTPPASPTSPSPSPSPAAWYAHHPILDIENLDLLGVRQRRVRFAINHYDRLARDDVERPTHIDPKAVLWAYKPPTPTGGFKSCARCTAAGLRELRRVAALVRGELVPEDLGWPPVVGEVGEGEGESAGAESAGAEGEGLDEGQGQGQDRQYGKRATTDRQRYNQNQDRWSGADKKRTKRTERTKRPESRNRKSTVLTYLTYLTYLIQVARSTPTV